MSALVNWEDYRRHLGSQDTRDELLRFYCAAAHYEPLDQWIDAHLANERTAEVRSRVNKLAIGGYGAGKTHWEIAEMMMTIIANPGGWFLVAAPTEKQAKGVLLPPYHEACAMLAANGYPIERRFMQNEKLSHLHCGGRVYFSTYRKIDHLMGFEFTGICADEIDTMNHSADIWGKLSSRCRKPNANFRQIFGATTPSGLTGTVAGIFHKNREAAAGLDDDAKRQELLRWFWAHGTGRGNPHLPPDYFDGLRNTLSRRQWLQNVEGKLLRPEACVWPEFERAEHVIPYVFDRSFPYSLYYDAGDQFPHILFVQHLPNGSDVIFGEHCPDQIPIDRLHADIIERCRFLRREPEAAVCDRAVKREISWMIEAFPKTHVQRMVTRRQQSVAEGIEVVRARLDPIEGKPKLYISEKLARDPGRRGIVKCVENYRYKRRIDGTLMPEPYKCGRFDHGCDALRMGMVSRHARSYVIKSVDRRL